jgi:probable F420-dependent oxidoreductase
MRIGIHVPQWGPDANREGVMAVARAANDAGLDSVWVADHVVYPREGADAYPFRDDGPPFAAGAGFLDAFTTLALAAGATERVALGTSVLVLPMREPLQLAKAVATLDVLSAGRLVIGAGVGWWAEEFRALGAPFAERGRRMDEQVAILRALWRDGILAHDGEFFAFEEVVCEPRPVQPGGPPILIGGMGAAARRRAGRIGDGWHALGSHAQTLADGFDEVRRSAYDSGRDEEQVTLSTSIALPPDPDRAIRRLARLADLGVAHVVLSVPENTADAICRSIDRLHAAVLPEVRG